MIYTGDIFPVGHIWAIYLMALLPLLWWLRFYLSRYRRASLEQLASSRLLAAIALQRTPWLYHIKTAALLGAWGFAVMALMAPKGNPHYQKISTSGRNPQAGSTPQEVLIVVDASESMEIKDTRLKVSRFAVAKDIAEQLINDLGGEYVGLYAMTSEATELSPPTVDYLFVLMELQEMTIDEGGLAGTDFVSTFYRVIGDAAHRNPGIRRTVVLLSDGGDQVLEDPKNHDKLILFQQQIQTLAKGGWRFFSVGIGTKEPNNVPGVTYEDKPVEAPLDDTLLKMIAKEGRGKYFSEAEMSILDIAKALSTAIERQGAVTIGGGGSPPREELIYDDYFQLPLTFAILCLIAMLLLPDVADDRRKR